MTHKEVKLAALFASLTSWSFVSLLPLVPPPGNQTGIETDQTNSLYLCHTFLVVILTKKCQ